MYWLLSFPVLTMKIKCFKAFYTPVFSKNIYVKNISLPLKLLINEVFKSENYRIIMKFYH